MRVLDGDQRLVRIFLGESDQYHRMPLHRALLERLRREGFAGATVIHGVAGFGASSVIHTARLLELSTDLPVLIEVVDDDAHIERLLPILDEMVTGGALVTVERVRVVKYAAGQDAGHARREERLARYFAHRCLPRSVGQRMPDQLHSIGQRRRPRIIAIVADFEALAVEHKDAVYRQLIRTCGNQEDAEDVLIEALLRAYQNLDQLREREAFRAWLAQIGRRVCWHLKRREALAPLLRLSALQEQGIQPVDQAPPPDVELERRELSDLLREAVAQLPPDQRSVYELRDLEGLSGERVARTLGITLAAQKSRLHRARTFVRAFLDRRLAGVTP